jgi:formylglycine-generating enzyme required for sulfatase activity
MEGVRRFTVVGYTAVCLAAAMPAWAGTLKCPPDSVAVGTVCIDTYEASLWQIPPSNTTLVTMVQQGKATLAALTAGGATQLDPAGTCTGADYPSNFPKSGNWAPVLGSNPPSPGVYAVSIPGVLPTACITWFQANQACLLSGKRLPTNAEWQGAAAGTPDPVADNGTSDCNIQTAGNAVNTGSRSSCKSSWGVFDMVGNVAEWVADWADLNLDSNCTDWTTSGAGLPGFDISCFGGPYAGVPLPAALIRGGDFFLGIRDAGVFSVTANNIPSSSPTDVGFRCAR